MTMAARKGIAISGKLFKLAAIPDTIKTLNHTGGSHG